MTLRNKLVTGACGLVFLGSCAGLIHDFPKVQSTNTLVSRTYIIEREMQQIKMPKSEELFNSLAYRLDESIPNHQALTDQYHNFFNQRKQELTKEYDNLMEQPEIKKERTEIDKARTHIQAYALSILLSGGILFRNLQSSLKRPFQKKEESS